MAYYDYPLDQLRAYQPALTAQTDFDRFWQATLDENRAFPLDARFTAVDYGLRTVEAFDVTFNGFHGQPVKGWFIKPRGVTGKLPTVVEFLGYGSGRSFPTERLAYPCAGFAYFVMDTRGQGYGGHHGDTPDFVDGGMDPQFPGTMTRGVLDPQTYFYRRVFSDAVRAVEAARSHPAVDGNRLAITGASQGGGITLAVAGLEPTIAAALPEVPFLCHFRRATQVIDTAPYNEIVLYLKSHRDQVDTVFKTLSYFDGMNFAARARAKALFSVGLRDDICPPSTVFAAYNHYAGEKQIKIYEFNQHEGGGPHHLVEKIKFLDQLWPDR